MECFASAVSQPSGASDLFNRLRSAVRIDRTIRAYAANALSPSCRLSDERTRFDENWKLWPHGSAPVAINQTARA